MIIRGPTPIQAATSRAKADSPAIAMVAATTATKRNGRAEELPRMCCLIAVSPPKETGLTEA